MDRSATNVFNTLFERGSKVFKLIREAALSPKNTKTLREWGITEAAEMIGRTSQTLRKLEESGKTTKARSINKGKRQERVYNLEEINQLRNYFSTRACRPEGSVAAKLGFVNFKGGAGKTTSAICSAQYFAKKGYKVLFIDCDSQGSATHMFGFTPDEDFAETDTLLHTLISDDPEKVELSDKIIKTHWAGLDLVPANLSLYNAELIIPTQIAEHAAKTGEQLKFYNRLNKAISKVEQHYDLIILDCPPSMGMISINAIYAANALVIEMPPVMVDFASTIQFFKMVSEVMERLPRKEYAFIRLMITKFNGRKNAKEIELLLREALGLYLMTNHMIESEAISKAASNMQTLYEIDKFVGDKRTYERAVQYADRVNEEIESLIQEMWSKSTLMEAKDLLNREIVNG